VRGRKPKSLARAEQEGDTRKIGAGKLRERIAAEPKAAQGLPGCPRYLKSRARAAWKSWREELAGMGLDRRPDARMLEGACVAYETAVYCYELVEKHGRFLPKRVIDPQKNELVTVGIMPNPAIAVGNTAWLTMRAFCSEFGLSPVSRTRLAAEKRNSGIDLIEAAICKPLPSQNMIVQ